MNLEKSILNAIDLSRRMEAALKVDDMILCNDLLEIRAVAMADFESSHRSSTEDEKSACSHLIKELVAADRSLQTQYKAALSVSGTDFRNSIGSAAGNPSGAYNTSNTAACVDRKA